MFAPLSGVRVLDVSSYIAGPYCTKILAEYGADVVKVERVPGGDTSRTFPVVPGQPLDPERSPLYLHLNANKRSVALDVSRAADLDIVEELLQRADVVVDDRVLAGLPPRFSYEPLSSRRPQLVLTVVSPFGRTGPYSQFRSSDMVLAAMGGWMYPMGDPGRPPLQPGGPWLQYVVGAWAAAGTLAALVGARNLGGGEVVDISSFEASVATTVEDPVWAQYTGEARGRYGTRWGADMSISLQQCLDGHVLIMGGPHRD